MLKLHILRYLTGEWNDTTIWSPAWDSGSGDIVLIDQETIVSTNGQREVAGFSILVGGELVLSGADGSLTITGNASWGVESEAESSVMVHLITMELLQSPVVQ